MADARRVQTLYEQQQPLLQSLGALSSATVAGLAEAQWAGRGQVWSVVRC